DIARYGAAGRQSAGWRLRIEECEKRCSRHNRVPVPQATCSVLSRVRALSSSGPKSVDLALSGCGYVTIHLTKCAVPQCGILVSSGRCARDHCPATAEVQG